MDTKTKIFWWTMGILILASFGATFYRYMIKKDYIVQAQVDCDPYGEACFVWNCDPVSEIEGEVCTGDPEADTWYYKIINKNASRIQTCDANDENCDALVCAQNEPNCGFVFCNPENMEENGASSCINPVQYTSENPIEEACEEGDEECLSSKEGEGEPEAGEDEGAESTEAINAAESTENGDENKIIETENSEVLAGDTAQKNEDSSGSLPVL